MDCLNRPNDKSGGALIRASGEDIVKDTGRCGGVAEFVIDDKSESSMDLCDWGSIQAIKASMKEVAACKIYWIISLYSNVSTNFMKIVVFFLKAIGD